MPFIGQSEIPGRFRAMAALGFAFLITPILPVTLAQPIQFTSLIVLIGREFLIGYCVGMVGSLLFTILDITGNIISLQIGLSSATMMNPTLHAQSALTSFIFTFFGIVIFLSMDLHHLMFRGFVQTYAIFPVNGSFLLGDVSQKFISLLSSIFAVGIQFAFPFLVSFTVLQIALGLMNRMIPQMQVMLVMLPFQILGGIIIIMMTAGAIFMRFGTLFDQEFRRFFGMG
jgi:flagellar biosynthetic protein FliR